MIPRYVPPDYVPTSVGDAVVWGRNGSIAAAAFVIPDATASVTRLLDYRLSRKLHVVVYASNEDACRALDRALHPTALLAPFHTRELALIALQAPSVDDRNGDPTRLRRHLCHELAHVFSAERTGSLKCLGDGDRGMRLLPWVDEGFAENVSSSLAARPDIITAALDRAAVKMSDDALATALRDLDSPDRESAFAIATTRVWRALQVHGYKFVFANLSNPETWLDRT